MQKREGLKIEMFENSGVNSLSIGHSLRGATPQPPMTAMAIERAKSPFEILKDSRSKTKLSMVGTTP
jgi:hypothetical protein